MVDDGAHVCSAVIEEEWLIDQVGWLDDAHLVAAHGFIGRPQSTSSHQTSGVIVQVFVRERERDEVRGSDMALNKPAGDLFCGGDGDVQFQRG